MIKNHSTIKSATLFVLERTKIEQAAEVKVSRLVYNSALSILNIAEKYHIGNNPKALMQNPNAKRQVDAVMESLRRSIFAYEKAAMKLSAEHIEGTGIKGVVEEYLTSKHWDKTFKQRTLTYTDRFRKDITNLIASGKSLGMDKKKIASAIRCEYKNPYSSSIVSKALRKGKVVLDIPKYGAGISKNAYDQIIKNVRGSIEFAWGVADHDTALKNGATGFYVMRGSSYPCEECQAHVGWLHKMSDDTPPFHINCKCIAIYTYKDEKEK